MPERAEYEHARLQSLERAIGFDALYVGAAAPDDPRQEPSVISGLGIRAIARSVLKLQGQVFGCLCLGRTSRGARFGGELAQLERALPVIALRERMHDLRTSSVVD